MRFCGTSLSPLPYCKPSSGLQHRKTVNNTGSLSCILASQPLFLIWYFCAKVLHCCQQSPPTQNPQDFPSLIQNCNQVTSLGESSGAASWFKMLCIWELLCRLPACWTGSISKRKSGKLAGTNCQNAHVTAQHESDGEEGIPANALLTDLLTWVSHSLSLCLLHLLKSHKLYKLPTSQHHEGQIWWWNYYSEFIERGGW